MRRPLLRHGAWLGLPLSVVLLTACAPFTDGPTAGSGGSAAASSSAARTTSTPQNAAAETSTPFCAAAAKVVSDADPSSGDTSNPDKAAAFLSQAAQRLRALTPPQDIATDWKAVADGLDQLGRAYADADLSDAQGEAELERTITALQTRMGPAQNHVNQYLHTACGLDTGGGTPTPTPSIVPPVLVPPPTG